MKSYGPLTLRQAQIVQLAAWGYPLDEIAILLGISLWTVKNHMKRINRALGTTGLNRSAAVTAALRADIITLEPPSKVAGLDDLEVTA